MRKNLLLLIMFCLVATIGAKAEVTSAGLSTDGKTLTFTKCTAGDVESYMKDAANADKIKNITSLVVNGAMSNSDMQALVNLTALSSLDLSAATGLTNTDITFNGEKTGNLQNKLQNTLTTIKFPKTGPNEIPEDCLKGYSIKNVLIPNGYTKIGKNAFLNCKFLQILNIPEGVEEIGEYAFQDAAIQSVRLPNSLKYIRSYAFANCANLSSVTIPKYVESIETFAFIQCDNLKDVYALGTGKDGTKIAELGYLAFSEVSTYGQNKYPYDTYLSYAAAAWLGTAKTINRDLYWNNDRKFCYLHFPQGCEDDYTYKSIHGSYLLTSATEYADEEKTTKIKYPTWYEGWQIYKADEDGKNTSWKSFVLAGEIKDNEIIPIPNIVASRWYTMCFDFPMTKGQIESAFGDGTEVCRFQGVKYNRNSSNGDVTATLDFTVDMYDASTAANTPITEAGHPYMIHPAAATSTVTYSSPVYYVTGVTKVSNCALVDDYGQVFGTSASNVDNYYPYGSYIFKGNLGSETKVPTGSYYLSRNNPTDDEKEDGHRAFYYNVNGNYNWTQYAATLYEDHSKKNYHGKTTNAGAKTCVAFGNDTVIFTSDNSTTGIENTESENSNETSVKFADKVFSISGQLVRTGSSSLDGLAKGMYIVNGKKYIVK